MTCERADKSTDEFRPFLPAMPGASSPREPAGKGAVNMSERSSDIGSGENIGEIFWPAKPPSDYATSPCSRQLKRRGLRKLRRNRTA
jgi:hypothetical protein